jgi:hypothetical protein
LLCRFCHAGRECQRKRERELEREVLVSLVEDDDFVATLRQSDLLLREHLYLPAHHVDASAAQSAAASSVHRTIEFRRRKVYGTKVSESKNIHFAKHICAPVVGGVQFKDGLAEGVAEQLSRQAQDACRLARARWTLRVKRISRWNFEENIKRNKVLSKVTKFEI